MHDHIVVTILHDEWTDWVWDDDPTSETYGEEYPIAEDIPFFLVEIYTEKYGVVTYGELPKFGDIKNVEYHIASDLQELKGIVPRRMFEEILCDVSEGDF